MVKERNNMSIKVKPLSNKDFLIQAAIFIIVLVGMIAALGYASYYRYDTYKAIYRWMENKQ